MATISASALASQAQADLIARNTAIAFEAESNVAAAIARVTQKTVSDSGAASDLEAINQQVANLVEQAELNNSGSVREFQKQTNDVKIDNSMTARDIGILRKNDSRLNLFSQLSANDTVDIFKFKVTSTAFTKLGILIADPTDKEQFRIQIFSRDSGTLIADNDSTAGDAYEAYQKLEAGSFELKQSDYIARVSRIPGKDVQKKDDIQYAVQLTQGIYKDDYDTIEKGYSESQDAFGFSISLANNADQLLTQLTSASSFISSLPPIGTSGTSKLTGALYDALF